MNGEGGLFFFSLVVRAALLRRRLPASFLLRSVQRQKYLESLENQHYFDTGLPLSHSAQSFTSSSLRARAPRMAETPPIYSAQAGWNKQKPFFLLMLKVWWW